MKNKYLTFVTGNPGKLSEVRAYLSFVEGKILDLPELQGMDIKKIVNAKLSAAMQLCDGPVMVDDTALYCDCFVSKNNDSNGLPGPLIKWFLLTLTNEGLAEIAEKLGNTRACARSVIGYAENKNKIIFFDGSVFGKITYPQGTSGFGWDNVFVPDGYSETFAKMGTERKNSISPRAIAIQKLKIYLDL